MRICWGGIIIKQIVIFLSIVLGFVILTGATCSPISPPAFTPSRSLKAQGEGNISVNMFGGATSELFDLSGYGAGIEAGYYPYEDTGITLNIFGSKGEDDLENNHSLFEGGLGLIRYFKKLNGDSYLLAFEPRLDFSFIIKVLSL